MEKIQNVSGHYFMTKIAMFFQIQEGFGEKGGENWWE